MQARKPINSAALCRRVRLILDSELVVLIRCLLYWTMPWNFGELEGLVGSILSYLSRRSAWWNRSFWASNYRTNMYNLLLTEV